VRKYAILKEKRLEEFRGVVDPAYLLSYIPQRACKGGLKRFEEIRQTNDWHLFLSSFQRSRIIKAIIKAGYSFYTEELQRKRSSLYRENYGLICQAVKRVYGTIVEDAVSEATVAFLEGIDNLLPEKLSFVKPSTYVFNHMVGRLREALEGKTGFSLLYYLKELCGIDNADQLIRKGLVRVNGSVVKNPKRKVVLTDEILLGEERPLLPSRAVRGGCCHVSYEDQIVEEELWEAIGRILGEREALAVRLRVDGYSVREVAKELGISSLEVSSAVKELKRRRMEIEEFLT